MTISLSDAGKRFNRDWIFRHFNYTFNTGNSYAIVGPNGSGKSTLLQAIGGAIGLSEGKLEVSSKSSALVSGPPVGNSELLNPGQQVQDPSHRFTRASMERSPAIDTENIYQYIAIAAPYLEVIEEMTATEFLAFHQTFKPLLAAVDIKEIIEIVGLTNAAGKQIRYYSSGMKQRIKLAQAIFSAVPVILLDEPCTNLDSTGIALYQNLIDTYCKDRLVIVSSNDEAEYGFCKEKLSMLAFK
ncbi:MAG: ATP-binding cassette domain-containing protein [Chitinophagaceae bacterium]